MRMKQVEHTNSERAVLEAVRHPFLVNLWGTFKDATFLYMVMDFVPGGELFTLLRKSQRFPHPVAKFYIAEVALAIDYLHQNNIVYRDLKPENILLSADGHLKITDFGFAKYVPDVTWTLCGELDGFAYACVLSRWGCIAHLVLLEMQAPRTTSPLKSSARKATTKASTGRFFCSGVGRRLARSSLSRCYPCVFSGGRQAFYYSRCWLGELTLLNVEMELSACVDQEDGT